MVVCIEAAAQPVTLPASAMLMALVVRVKEYCCRRAGCTKKEHKCTVPAQIVAMYPCVKDALLSNEEDYVKLQYYYFSIVVQGSLLGEHVYEQEETHDV